MGVVPPADFSYNVIVSLVGLWAERCFFPVALPAPAIARLEAGSLSTYLAGGYSSFGRASGCLSDGNLLCRNFYSSPLTWSRHDMQSCLSVSLQRNRLSW